MRRGIHHQETKVICDMSEQYGDQAMRATPYRFLC